MDTQSPHSTHKHGRHLRVPVLPEEEANAAQAGMRVAAYLRAIALGYQVRSVVDNQQVEALVRISGELQRLSKLLEHRKSNDPRPSTFSQATLQTSLCVE